MRIGFSLPHFGPAASPQAIVEAAQQAEALGYDSLWVGEFLRVLKAIWTTNPVEFHRCGGWSEAGRIAGRFRLQPPE